MNNKQLGIITRLKETGDNFKEQLQSIFGEELQLESVYLQDGPGTRDRMASRVILVSNQSTLEDAKAARVIGDDANIIIAKRTLSLHRLDALEELLKLPPGTKVLVAYNTRTDNVDIITEVIGLMRDLGINHLEFIPNYPGQEHFPGVEVAVTFGTSNLVPRTIKRFIDLGWTQLDIKTIVDIVQALAIWDGSVRVDSHHFVKAVVALAQNLVESSRITLDINKRLEGVLKSSSEGIIVLNAKQEVVLCNDTAMDALKRNQDELTGCKLQDIFGGELQAKWTAWDNEQTRLVNLHGSNFMLAVSDLDREGKLGYVAVLRKVSLIQNMEEQVRKQLYSKDYTVKYNLSHILTKSPKMEELKAYTQMIAKSDFDIMIYGESGTGKELFAQAIHSHSNRPEGPFVATNVAAFSDSLIESELFGYDDGAFTGAKRGGKPGLFELAHNGTIFLDEIGELSLPLQSKLLRVIQEREVRRVGSAKTVPIRIRIVAATNKNLAQMVKKGTFREDLFYRLHVLPVKIPPLRDRREDIMPILDSLLSRFRLSASILSEPIMRYLAEYRWPGNVRQLDNFSNYLACLVQMGFDRESLYAKVMDYFEDIDLEEGAASAAAPGEDNVAQILEKRGSLGEYTAILLTLKAAYDANRKMSRSALADALRTSAGLSVQKVRERLQVLEELGLIVIGQTKQGTRISERGIQFLVKNELG